MDCGFALYLFPPVTHYTVHTPVNWCCCCHTSTVLCWDDNPASRTMLMSKHTLTWHKLTDIHIRLLAMEINNSERPHMHIPYITTSPHGVSPCVYRGIQMFPAGQLIKWCLDNSAPENTVLGSISQVFTVIQDSLMLLITAMRKRSWRTRRRKYNLANQSESVLKRSEQRAVCSEGKVMQNIFNKHCQKCETRLWHVIQFEPLENSCRFGRKTFFGKWEEDWEKY